MRARTDATTAAPNGLVPRSPRSKLPDSAADIVSIRTPAPYLWLRPDAPCSFKFIRHLRQRSRQFSSNLLGFELPGAVSGDDYYGTCGGQHGSQTATKAFTQPTLDPIARYRTANPARNRQSELHRLVLPARRQIDDKMVRLTPNSPLANPQEIGVASQPVLFPETGVRSRA